MSSTKTIDRIRENFQKNAESLFLIEDPLGLKFTYEDFYQLSLKAADLLLSQGIKKGDRVVLILPNSSEYAAFYFGLLMIGASAVPINQALHAKEINYILSHVQARLIVFSMTTRALVLAAIEGLVSPQLCLLLKQEKALHPEESGLFSLEDRDGSLAKDIAFKNITDDDTFTITFTSGTTSKPKGVVHRISSQFDCADVFNQELEIKSTNRYINFWPMAYSTGILNTLLCPFMAGASVVIAPVFDTRTLLSFWKPIIANQANTMWLSPSMAAALVHVDRNPEGIKYCAGNDLTICIGTAPLALKVKKDFETKYKLKVFESYGLSETLFVATNSRKYPQKDRSVGRLLPGVKAHLLNENGQKLTAPIEGEIAIETPFLLKGYLDFETTDGIKLFKKDDVFSTGDIGCFDKDGDLFITGRKKDLIIRAGLNVSPRVIEEVILMHPTIEAVCVVGIPHEYFGEEIVAIVKFKRGFAIEEEKPALLKLCRANLNEASIPTKFIERSTFIVGSTGKVQKNQMREEVILSLLKV